MGKVINGKTLLTYSDYVLFPEDGRQHEIIGGVHHVTPSPVTKHQRISRRIQFQLYQQIEVPGRGEVFDAPMDLVLSDTDVVQPDLMVVLEKNRLIVTPKNIRGAPDLIVEITSPRTETRDLDLKKTLYQAHGVSEYWIVLTDEDAVDRFLLDEGSYRHDGQYRERIAFAGMDGVSVDLTSVW